MIRVLVLGYGPMGLALTQGILEHPQLATLVGVFPWSLHPDERYYARESSEQAFRWFLQKHHLPVIQAPSVNHFEFIRQLEQLQPDLVLVGSWGEIIQPHVLAIPEIQFINCHPSLLPYHRGANPYTAVLLANESQTGITYHLMDQGIDTGPILLQRAYAIETIDTGGSLRDKAAREARLSVKELLEQWASDTLILTQQPPGSGSYDRLPHNLGELNWGMDPGDMDRYLRALYPWFPIRGCIKGRLFEFASGRLTHTKSRDSLKASGTVLAQSFHHIRVATCDPDYQVQLNLPRLCCKPASLSRLLASFLLRRGQQFSSIR